MSSSGLRSRGGPSNLLYSALSVLEEKERKGVVTPAEDQSTPKSQGHSGRFSQSLQKREPCTASSPRAQVKASPELCKIISFHQQIPGSSGFFHWARARASERVNPVLPPPHTPRKCHLQRHSAPALKYPQWFPRHPHLTQSKRRHGPCPGEKEKERLDDATHQKTSKTGEKVHYCTFLQLIFLGYDGAASQDTTDIT